jgi:formiminotetrahydrofolate cyclodeaminase
MTLEQFTGVLASDAPAPGGGSVAALNGALAASLVHMVGALTLGKEKYKDFHGEMAEIMNAAKKLQDKLLIGIDEDTEAFNKVSAVFSMPKDTPEQKTARSESMQTALKGAALTPLETMKAAHECLKLAGAAYGKTNASCLSDYGSAVLCAIASVRAAWLNVKINISSIKDEEFAKQTGQEAREILAESEKMAEELYDKLEKAM